MATHCNGPADKLTAGRAERSLGFERGTVPGRPLNTFMLGGLNS